MCLYVIIYCKLSKAIGIGIFQNQQFAGSRAVYYRCSLIGIKKYGVLVFSIQVFSFINGIRNVISAVVIDLAESTATNGNGV